MKRNVHICSVAILLCLLLPQAVSGQAASDSVNLTTRFNERFDSLNALIFSVLPPPPPDCTRFRYFAAGDC